MELSLRPRRKKPWRDRGPVLLAMATLVVGWLGALLLVPTLLGLGTSVVTQPGGAHEVGTLMLTRSVPASDLGSTDAIRLGNDVRRVSAATPGVLVIDRSEHVTTSETHTLERVLFVVPLAGLPLAGPDGLVRWLLGVGIATLFTLVVTSVTGSVRRAGQVRLAV